MTDALPVPVEGLRALTVRHPWAWAIVRGGKRVENRSWSTRYRGPLAIHAAARIDVRDVKLAAAWANAGGSRNVLRYCVDTAGSIIAVCQLVDCLPPEQDLDDRWALPGYFHWILEDVDELIEPIPARGRLGLWTPDGPPNG